MERLPGGSIPVGVASMQHGEDAYDAPLLIDLEQRSPVSNPKSILAVSPLELLDIARSRNDQQPIERRQDATTEFGREPL
jgi:hypothetical protein